VALTAAQAAAARLGAAALLVLDVATPPDQLDITRSDYTSVESAVESADEWLQLLLPPSTGVTVFVDGVSIGTIGTTPSRAS